MFVCNLESVIEKENIYLQTIDKRIDMAVILVWKSLNEKFKTQNI